MDNTNSAVDPQEEVRKLQELVRKLEQQNQQLRSKQNQGSRQRSTKDLNPAPSKSVLDSKPCTEKGVVTNLTNVAIDDDDLIDVNQLDSSTEDSWLYESPMTLTAEQKAVSPYQWLRIDVEDAGNTDIQTVKRALVRKIEELSRAPNPYISIQNSIAQRHQLHPDNAIDQRTRCSGGPKFLLSPREFDSRTFTRSKKRHPFELPVVDGENLSKDDRLHGTATPPLTDLIDIHTIARLQEESLRQSSTPSTPRRNSAASSSCQKPGISPIAPVNESDEHDTSLGNLTFTVSGCNSLIEGSPRTLSSRTSSSSASPSASPRGSQYFDDITSVIGKSTRCRPSRPLNGIVSARGMIKAIDIGMVNGLADSGTTMISDQLQRNPGSAIVQLQSQERNSRSSSSASRASGVSLHNGTMVLDSVSSKSAHHSKIPKPRTKSSIPTFARNRPAVDESWKDGCY